jgi:hypothetical protein
VSHRDVIAASLVLLLGFGVGTGCTTVEQPALSSGADATMSLEGLLRYGEQVSRLDAETLETTITDVERSLSTDDTAPNRIKLAMLLSQPRASLQDNARAQTLLSQVLQDPASDAHQYRDLAAFLLSMLADATEQRRQRLLLEQQLEQLKVIERDTGNRIPTNPIRKK